MEQIIEAYKKGTDYNIHMDGRGILPIIRVRCGFILWAHIILHICV